MHHNGGLANQSYTPSSPRVRHTKILGMLMACLFVLGLYSKNTLAAISVTQNNFALGEVIEVTFSDSENWRDWIGLYEKGAIEKSCEPSRAFKAWRYAFLSSGTVALRPKTALPAGEYQIQMFQNNTYCHLGSPLSITIGDVNTEELADTEQDTQGSDAQESDTQETQGSTTKVLAVTPIYAAGETISVEYFTGTGGKRDWIGIYLDGDLNDSCQETNQYVAWQYTNGNVGTLRFDGLTPGNYVAQLFSDNSYCHLGQFESFQVTADDDDQTDGDNITPALILNNAQYSVGQNIQIEYTRGTGEDRDWVGIYAQGDLNKSCQRTDKYISWQYTNGTAGNLVFDPLPAGQYVAQLFSDNSYCHLGQDIAFDVSVLNTGIEDSNGDDNNGDENNEDSNEENAPNNGNDSGDDSGNNNENTNEDDNDDHTGNDGSSGDDSDNSTDGSSDNDTDNETGNTGLPPSLAKIFNPLTEHFAEREGTIRISGLDLADAVCYASNGVQPSWNSGNCAGEGITRIDNPDATFTITLECNGETGAKVARHLKLVFNWPNKQLYLAEAQFQLTCLDDSQAPEPEATLTTNKNSYQEGETTIVSYAGATQSTRDWVGIFKAGALNKSCDETERYVTWEFAPGRQGSVSFTELSTGEYQAQLFVDNSYCHLGEPINFSVTPSENTDTNDGDSTENNEDNNEGNNEGNNEDNNDQCPNDPDKVTPGECGCGMPEGACNPQNNTRVTLNPYANVNWDSWRQYKANYHTHTTQSDGDHDPAEVIDEYHSADYKILSITDHNTVTWPWTDYNRDPDDLGMLAVRGDEFSRAHHVNGFFEFSVSRADHKDGIASVQREGGLCHFNHPLRYNSANDWDWYIPWYEDYPACVGLEAINRGTHAHRLWDNINENLFTDKQQLVWGYANDDMHDRSELFRSFQFMLMPNLSEGALRTSKRTGAFYFCHEPKGSGQARVPQISRIDVDNQAQTITIVPQGNNYRAIEWIGPGTETVGDGTVFNFSNYPSGSFVRAKIEGGNGSCYTQPFGIQG